MKNTFAEIVETIEPLSIEEKQELLDLIQKYLIEERRLVIYENALASMSELNEGKLQFSDDLGQLKGMLSNV